MNKVVLLFTFGLFLSCKKELKDTPIPADSLKQQAKQAVQTKDTIAYFENALVYQYDQNGEKEELWIYVNEKQKQLLFVPNDDMIQAVISYPNGKYKIFGTNEKVEKVILKQFISSISEEQFKDEVLEKLDQNKVISQKNIQQKDILCEGFKLNYTKMEGGETIFATTQIAINSLQLYGFSKLDGDCKLPINIDYSSVFRKNQLISHIESDNFKLELLNYGPNPYEFNLKEYIEKQ